MAIKEMFLPLVGEPDAAAIAAIDKCMAVAGDIGARVIALAVEEEIAFRPKVVISPDIENVEAAAAERSVADARGLLKAFEAAANRFSIRNGARGGRGVIPGDRDAVEPDGQFADDFLRAHQDRPARFENKPLDKLLGSIVMRFDRHYRQIHQPRGCGEIRENIRWRKAADTLFVANGKAVCRSLECLQQPTRIRHAAFRRGGVLICDIG